MHADLHQPRTQDRATSPTVAAAIREVAGKRRVRPRKPGQRSQRWFREYHGGKPQRQIARDDGVAQSSVSRAVKRCATYIAAAGAAVEEIDPAGQLHLANVTEAMELEALRREAEDLSRRAELPYPRHKTIVQRPDGTHEERVVMYQEPPRVVFVRERRMLTTALWKARREAAEAESAAAAPPDALSPPLATAEPYDELCAKQWELMDRRGRTCARKGSGEPVSSLPARTAYWRYQALGVELGLKWEQRQDLVSSLAFLDGLALRAAAMVEVAGQGAQDPRGEIPTPAAVVHCLQSLLVLDLDYSPEQCAQALAHFDAARGQFNWQMPHDDLRWVLETEEETPGDKSRSTPPCPPASDDPPEEIPYAERTPQSFSSEERGEILALPFNSGVYLKRLHGTTLACRTLRDVPNDEHSVVIWELLERVYKGEETEEEKMPVNGEPANGSPGGNTNALVPGCSSVAAQLTDELRQKLFHDQYPEGNAVLTASGQVYAGEYLSDTGLPEGGFLFLRELCHSTPPWGESVWETFRR